jgi:hypothetical protein
MNQDSTIWSPRRRFGMPLPGSFAVQNSKKTQDTYHWAPKSFAWLLSPLYAGIPSKIVPEEVGRVARWIWVVSSERELLGVEIDVGTSLFLEIPVHQVPWLYHVNMLSLVWKEYVPWLPF